jgi:hypothetical protein
MNHVRIKLQRPTTDSQQSQQSLQEPEWTWVRATGRHGKAFAWGTVVMDQDFGRLRGARKSEQGQGDSGRTKPWVSSIVSAGI